MRLDNTHCQPSLLTCPAVFGAAARSCVTDSLHISPRFSIRYVTFDTSFESAGSYSTCQVITSRRGGSHSSTLPSTSRLPSGLVEYHSDPRFQSEWISSAKKYFFVT